MESQVRGWQPYTAQFCSDCYSTRNQCTFRNRTVPLARALAAGPGLLLMDEPFGAVDEITRGQLQDELLRIHRESGITVLFVTHDIAEALKLGTRTLVMDAGQIQQYDAPSRLLAHPATSFVERLVRRSRVFQTRA